MAMVSPELLPINHWESRALQHQFPAQTADTQDTERNSPIAWRPLQDSIIYPGLYSRSGYDVVSLLFRVMSRPNPKIEIGAVDCSAALIVCDLALPDSPIVYVSDTFCELTGYSVSECIGRNCRFLQEPPGNASSRRPRSKPRMEEDDRAVVKRLHHAVYNSEEIQVLVTNFKKNGDRFQNLLSIVPLEKEPSGQQYAIGFQAQVNTVV